MAAFQGDFIEHAPRRLFVQHLSASQPVYTYRMHTSFIFVHFKTLTQQTVTNFHKIDGLGTVCLFLFFSLQVSDIIFQPHGSELLDIFGGGPLGDYLIRFASTLDPNGDGAPEWPRYMNDKPLMLTFNDAQPAFNLTPDTYRSEEIELLVQLSLADPI